MKAIILIALLSITFAQNYSGTWFVDFSYPTYGFKTGQPNSIPQNSSFVNATVSGGVMSINFISTTGSNLTYLAYTNGNGYCDSYWCRTITFTNVQGLLLANYTVRAIYYPTTI